MARSTFNNLSIVTIFNEDDEVIENYLLYKLMKQEFTEKGCLYTRVTFNIYDIPENNFKYMFRFDRKDIYKLFNAMQLPRRFETFDRHVIGGVEGLCLLLRRFAYPSRLWDLQNEFGLQYSSISKLFKYICNFIYMRWGKLLLNFSENKWLTIEYLEEIAALVNIKGAPLKNCVGFIDGTARPTCRPTKLQKELYGGHKRTHCLKFQAVTLPNGIILHLSAPYPGRRHDAFMLRDTLMMEQLELYCPQFCIYGDEGYPLRKQLIRPFSNTVLTDAQKQSIQSENVKVESVCGEWSFGKVVQLFAFVDFKKNQKLFLQPVGKYYSVAVLLTNAHTCLYGSHVSRYFDIESPDLMVYFK